MSFVAAAIGGGAVLGLFGSMDASRKQANSAGDARALTDAQYKQSRGDLMPWQTSGKGANKLLSDMLGIETTQPSGPDWERYLRDNPDVAASAMYANNPAQHYEDWGKKEGRTVNQLSATPPAHGSQFGSLLKPFTMGDLQNEPGYQFGLSEGEKGIDRAAAAASGRYSGATLKALTRFNENYAGTKYDAAFARDASTKNRQYSMLSGVSGMGENAAGMTAGLGANSAANGGNFLTQAGNANAAGDVGSINAVTGAVNTGLNYYQNQQLLNSLGKRGGTGTTPYTMDAGGNF